MSSRSLRLVILAALVAVAAGPLAATYLHRLWEWPHYQFYPVLFAVVAMIVWQRWPTAATASSAPGNAAAVPAASPPATGELAATNPPRRWSLLLIWIGFAVEAAALWLDSPWLGYLALVLMLGGVLQWASGAAWRSLLPAWLLLFLVMRPPLRLDESLIRWLQQKTAAESSRILDMLKIDHVREGVLIEIPGRTLFVEEACSGVQSLFSLVTMAAVLAVWNRRPVLWSLLLIVAAIVGAGATNILRTVSIVVGLERFEVDLLAEPQHTILGLIVFGLSLAWLASFDQLLSFFMSPIGAAGDFGPTANVWVRFWDRWIAPAREMPQTATAPDIAPTRDRGFWLAGSVAAVLGAAGLWLSATRTDASLQSLAEKSPLPTSPLVSRLEALNEQSLPEQIGDWRRVRYEHKARKVRSMFGDYSQTWCYEGPHGRVVLSLDFPFRGWHDLRECYEAIGWKVRSTESFAVRDEPPGRVRVDLDKSSTLETSYLVFGACDENLNFVAAPNKLPAPNTVLGRLTFVSDESALDIPTFQFQAFAVGELNWDAESRAEVERLFEMFHQAIQARVVAAEVAKP